MFITSSTEHALEAYDDIVFLESQNTTILVHQEGGTVVKIYDKLDDIEGQLDDKRFLRTHKSYLVNMNKIKRVEENFITNDNQEVVIRTRGSSAIKNAYFEYIRNRNLN